MNRNFFFVFCAVFLLTFSIASALAVKTGSDSGSFEFADSKDGAIIKITSSYCGDGRISLALKEECDRLDLGGNNCESFGFDGGTLSCKNSGYPEGSTPGLCTLDYSNCYYNSSVVAPVNPVTNPSSGGTTTPSGGGGGTPTITNNNENNESEECIIDWECEDWGKCTDGVQTRVCVDLNVCGTDTLKPSEERECINEGISGDEATMEGYKPGFFRTTGLAISDSFRGSGNYLGWIILALIILGSILFFASKKQEKDKFPEHPKNNKIKGN